MNQQPVISCYNCKSQKTTFFTRANDVEYFTSDKQYNYFRCNDCEVLFIHPQPKEELNLIYPPNYYSFKEDLPSISFKIKNKLDQQFFKKHLNSLPQKKLKVLDIGGGTGVGCDNIIKGDNRIVYTQIVDLDMHAGSIAKQKGHQYFCGTIEEFVTNEQFDVVLMLNLVEHVSEPLAILLKVKSLLTVDGIVIIKTPNYQSLDARIFKNKSWGGYHCPRHWILFDKKSFNLLSKRSGLFMKFFEYTQGAPFWTVSILHQLHKWNWIKANKQQPLVYHPLFGIISMFMATFDFLRRSFAPLSQMFIILGHRPKDS